MVCEAFFFIYQLSNELRPGITFVPKDLNEVMRTLLKDCYQTKEKFWWESIFSYTLLFSRVCHLKQWIQCEYLVQIFKFFLFSFFLIKYNIFPWLSWVHAAEKSKIRASKQRARFYPGEGRLGQLHKSVFFRFKVWYINSKMNESR